jgi:hypothetical protein
VTFFRGFLLHETLLGAISVLVLLSSSNGQQETEPSWYDPWAKTTATTAPVKRTTVHPMISQTRFTKNSTTSNKQGHKQNRRSIATCSPKSAVYEI